MQQTGRGVIEVADGVCGEGRPRKCRKRGLECDADDWMRSGFLEEGWGWSCCSGEDVKWQVVVLVSYWK